MRLNSNRQRQLILGILFFLHLIINAQPLNEALKKPTIQNKILYLKLLCFSDHMQLSAYMSLDVYIDVISHIDKYFVVDTLHSKGVKDVNFLRVSFNRRDSIQKLYKELEKQGNYFGRIQYLTGSEYFVHPDLLNHEYIFASSPFGLYKLNGFRLNDFRKFYADCFNTGDCFVDEEIKRNRGDLSDKKLIETWSVEGIDLWCMYEKHVKGKKCRKDCFEFNQE